MLTYQVLITCCVILHSMSCLAVDNKGQVYQLGHKDKEAAATGAALQDMSCPQTGC